MLKAVINKFLILFIIVFSINNTFSQQKINENISFVGKNEDGRYITINRFLDNNSAEELKKIQENCIGKYGVFKFSISKVGQISDLEVSGNLPDNIIKTLKNRITSLEGNFIFNEGSKTDKIYIHYPFYISISLETHCKIDVEDAYYKVIKQFGEHNILYTNEGYYMIKPGFLFAMI